jgi:UDP-N-acetylmuramyl pentapeptide phosphotransferase/UDP-N-acetylglucosamine-1-phosphate transferase
MEDYTQKVGPRWRLAAGAATAALGCGLLGLSVQRMGLSMLDGLWQELPWLAIGLAFLAISGLPHAFNMIDGYNGLAGIVAVLVSGALAYVALLLGDRLLAAMLVSLVGATLGFLYWNYPRGLIFAGDGGAYLWGAVIGVASIMLVQRNAEVSPWFPMLLLIYPVFETMFSVYRKLARGVSPGVADALHFHQLIYRRIVRGVVHDDMSRRMLMRNNRTSPYLWSFTLLTVVPAVLFWQNTPVLIGFCSLFVFTYIAFYIAIIRFRIPRWLRRP